MASVDCCVGVDSIGRWILNLLAKLTGAKQVPTTLIGNNIAMVRPFLTAFRRQFEPAQNLHPNVALMPRSFFSALTGDLLSKLSYT